MSKVTSDERYTYALSKEIITCVYVLLALDNLHHSIPNKVLDICWCHRCLLLWCWNELPPQMEGFINVLLEV
jgi:hypothetical protein